MKNIIVIVRTRNSEKEIVRFINSYQWADAILVADGGSEDNTALLAADMPKTYVRFFDEKISRGNIWRNPHGRHINFLIDWAENEFDAGWIIFDDSDCVPNYYVKENARDYIESSEQAVICITRLYIKGTVLYYPKYSQLCNNAWTPSLWAWKAGLIRAKEDNPLVHEFNDFSVLRTNDWMPPACLLHYFYPDEDTMNKKLEFYDKIGEIPNAKHPDKGYAKGLEYLPEWAHE